jgi:hypothetical protein
LRGTQGTPFRLRIKGTAFGLGHQVFDELLFDVDGELGLHHGSRGFVQTDAGQPDLLLILSGNALGLLGKFPECLRRDPLLAYRFAAYRPMSNSIFEI